MRLSFAVLLLLSALCCAAQPPTPAAKRWWSHVEVLADDKLEGRDTGSEGYRAAARYVVEQFERAGLKPAGEKGYYQPVPMRSLAVKPDSKITLIRDGVETPLKINEQVGVTPRQGIPGKVEGRLVFAGTQPGDVTGKFAVVLGGGRGAAGPALTGAGGVISIDNPRGLEAPRWPVAYARTVAVEGGAPRAAAGPGLGMRFNPDFAEELFKGSGHTFAEMIDLASAGKPLPHFELKGTLRAEIGVEAAGLTSDNIIAMLPGSELPDEIVVVSAHLDGYGLGTPVNGDRIYNGAFDDAACVANLIELAWDLKRSGKKLRRSVLFAVFTGEEKGLLGSQYFTTHFTVPKEKIVADINLDYIRPIFPLRILTTLGLTESTLGDMARRVAEPLGIRIQPDDEPERGLFRRSDQYNFIRNGIPGIAFIFGYEKGSPEERIYRAWYKDRYHRPSDDLKQPVDFAAAEKFHRFFSGLAEAAANSADRPALK